MTVLLVLLLFGAAIAIDFFHKAHSGRKAVCPNVGTMYTTPGYEFLGALAQDGGEPHPDTYRGAGI
jgi:hypothetical protein